MGPIVDKSCEFLQKEASNGYTEFMSSKHHHFFMSFHSCGNPRKGNKCSKHGKRRHGHFLVKEADGKRGRKAITPASQRKKRLTKRPR